MKNSLTRSNLQRDSTSDKRSPRGSHVSGSVGCLSAVQETHKSACSRKRVRFARKRAESRLSDHLSYQTVRISWTPRCSRLVGISLLSLNDFYEENQRRASRQKFRWEIFKFWSETCSGFTSGLIISAGCSSKSPKNLKILPSWSTRGKSLSCTAINHCTNEPIRQSLFHLMNGCRFAFAPLSAVFWVEIKLNAERIEERLVPALIPFRIKTDKFQIICCDSSSLWSSTLAASRWIFLFCCSSLASKAEVIQKSWMENKWSGDGSSECIMKIFFFRAKQSRAHVGSGAGEDEKVSNGKKRKLHLNSNSIFFSVGSDRHVLVRIFLLL